MSYIVAFQPPIAILRLLTLRVLLDPLRSVKLRPFKQQDGTWNFSEKWILREAVKPFITQELVRPVLT